MRKIVAFLVLLALFLLPALGFAGTNKEVARLRKGKIKLSFDDLFSLTSSMPDAVLIDARGPKAYQAGHIPTAINLPGWELDLHMGLLPAKETLVILYCDGSGCSMSYYLADKLLGIGYQKVAVYDGGVREWAEQKHLPLVTAEMEKMQQIQKPELELLVASGAPTLFDVRPAFRYLFGTIGQAKNLPFNDVQGKPELLPESKETPIVLFGENRIDSAPYAAAAALSELGYGKVRIYTPGVAGYKAGKEMFPGPGNPE